MSGKDLELKTIKKLDNSRPEPVGQTSLPVGSDNPPTSERNEAAFTNRGYVVDSTDVINQSELNATKKSDIDGEVDQYEEVSEDEDEEYTSYVRHVATARNSILSFYDQHTKAFKVTIYFALALMYFVYFGFAQEKTFDVHDESSMRLLIVTIVAVVFIVVSLLWPLVCRTGVKFDLFDEDCEDPTIIRAYLIHVWHPCVNCYWILVAGCVIFIIAWVVVDVALNRPENLISVLGIFVFVLTFYIFSYKPHKVNWRPVFWGLVLQFFFALLILRTNFGYDAFQWLGKRIEEFLLHTDAGSKFIFGDAFMNHFFAFKVLPVIVFFSSVVSVLYYWGAMQFVIKYIARFLAFCLGTSPAESLNAAGNIFIGQSESPLMIRPFLKDMTKSELHAICTGGFATIAGSVMAAYIAIDVPANHLLSASVMSAPAALAMSKLFWPESRKPKSKGQDVYNMKKGTEHNFIEAASKGASLSISLIANIAVNLIAFIALLHFVDETLRWLGHRVGLVAPEERELTFRLICRYVFYPVAWLMGVTDTEDAFKIGALIGTKTFLNEFVAYTELSVYIKNTHTYDLYMANSTGMYNGTYYEGDDLVLDGLDNTTTLIGGIMQERSIIISTYALCGFSNISSIGIMLGALGALAPTRKRDITKVVVRAMIAGNVACFMTATIAGLLYVV